MTKKANIQTFGCQMNKLDSELISGALINAGYELTEFESEADVILVNTCSVRKHAEERVYSRVMNLKKLKAKKPHLVIGIIGCMAQKDKEEVIRRLPHVSLVCGPHRYQSIVEMIKNLAQDNTRPIIRADEQGLESSESYTHANYLANDKSAFIQIMRGCDNYCTYCIVPYVRGREISRPPDEIIKEAGSLADKGVREIILLGQNVTAYSAAVLPIYHRGNTADYPRLYPAEAGQPADGKSLKPMANLAYLLKELANHLRKRTGSQDFRISFVTSHPAKMTNELLTVMQSLPEVKQEIHMPAQSGSDRILKMMNRGYTRKEYLAIVKNAQRLMPKIKIVSDFIVGFPSETNDDFEQTISLVKEAGFSKIYVFKYSPRTGTAAEKLIDDVPLEAKKHRNNYLLEVFKSSRIIEKN